MSIPRQRTLKCGKCPAEWSDLEGQYVGECQCPPEEQRDRWLKEEYTWSQIHAASQRRSEAVPYSKPFSIWR